MTLLNLNLRHSAILPIFIKPSIATVFFCFLKIICKSNKVLMQIWSINANVEKLTKNFMQFNN